MIYWFWLLICVVSIIVITYLSYKKCSTYLKFYKHFAFRYVVPKPRAECTKGEQLIVTFGAGYIAGVFCAIVSHPADTLVSKLNQAKGASIGDIVGKIGFMGE